MKKLLIALLCLTFAVGVYASEGKSVSMTGWLGDSKCGAKKGPEHADCAKSCVKMGEKVTLIEDGEGKIYKIENQASVKKLAGEHVQVDGSLLADGTLHVNKVAPVKP